MTRTLTAAELKLKLKKLRTILKCDMLQVNTKMTTILVRFLMAMVGFEQLEFSVLDLSL